MPKPSPPSPLQQLVSLFAPHEADEEDVDDDVSGIRAITVRLPISRIAQIDALAEHVRMSRQAMANELLKVALSEVLHALPESVQVDIAQSAEDHLHNLLP